MEGDDARREGTPEGETPGGGSLTALERELLRTALDGGYFDSTRDMTLADLADEVELTEQEASERLRRAIGTLLRNSEWESGELENEE
jgi:predicted DNA binding protein